jgi:hypothetical protein
MSITSDTATVDWDGEDKSGYQNNYWYQNNCEEGEEENNDDRKMAKMANGEANGVCGTFLQCAKTSNLLPFTATITAPC